MSPFRHRQQKYCNYYCVSPEKQMLRKEPSDTKIRYSFGCTTTEMWETRQVHSVCKNFAALHSGFRPRQTRFSIKRINLELPQSPQEVHCRTETWTRFNLAYQTQVYCSKEDLIDLQWSFAPTATAKCGANLWPQIHPEMAFQLTLHIYICKKHRSHCKKIRRKT